MNHVSIFEKMTFKTFSRRAVAPLLHHAVSAVAQLCGAVYTTFHVYTWHRLGRNGPALTCRFLCKIKRIIFDSISQFQKKSQRAKLPMRQCSFVGEFAQYLCQGDSLSGIAVLFKLLNRALAGCVDSIFLFRIKLCNAVQKTSQHKKRGKR